MKSPLSFLLGFIALTVFVVSSNGLRLARDAEREGSNDVNSRRDSDVATSQDPSTGLMPDHHDDDDEDDFGEPGDGMFFSFRPFGFDDMYEHFRRMEQVMHQLQNRLVNMTADLPATYDNSTSEIVEINGKRYKLEKTVVKRGDNNTSFFVSATSLVPADKRRKREISNMESIAEKLNRRRRNADTEESSEEDDG